MFLLQFVVGSFEEMHYRLILYSEERLREIPISETVASKIQLWEKPIKASVKVCTL